MTKSKTQYEKVLNAHGEDMSCNTICMRYGHINALSSISKARNNKHKLGYYLKKYDPIQFQVGYKEWSNE